MRKEKRNLKKLLGVAVVAVATMFLGVLCFKVASYLEKNEMEVEENAEFEKYGIYADFMLEKGYKKDYPGEDEPYSYEIDDMDNNGVPELLFRDGIHSAANIGIYTMKDEEVVFLGKYSRYGNLRVYKGEDHSILCSQYGGMGAFTHVYTKMKDGEMETLAAKFIDATGLESEEIVYYANFPFPAGLRADNFLLDYSLLTEEYQVTEEEYDAVMDTIFDKSLYAMEEYTCSNLLEPDEL